MAKHTIRAIFTLEVETDDIDAVLADFDYEFVTGVPGLKFTRIELDDTELIPNE